jgi:hypothetical protein
VFAIKAAFIVFDYEGPLLFGQRLKADVAALVSDFFFNGLYLDQLPVTFKRMLVTIIYIVRHQTFSMIAQQMPSNREAICVEIYNILATCQLCGNNVDRPPDDVVRIDRIMHSVLAEKEQHSNQVAIFVSSAQIVLVKSFE